MSGVNIEQIDKNTTVFKFANGSLNVTIRHGDISEEQCDALVNPTSESMEHDGGLDSIIHKTMGPFYTDQVAAVRQQNVQVVCPVGQSRIFIATFNRKPGSPRFIINTVGPVYKKDEKERAAFHLQSCYHTSLTFANLYGLSSIAYPAISCGAYHYPPQEAAQIGIESVRQYSFHVSDVRFVLFERETFNVFVQEWTDYAQKINIDANIIEPSERLPPAPSPVPTKQSALYCILCKEQQLPADHEIMCTSCLNLSRSEVFIKMLQRLRSSAEKNFTSLQKECAVLKPILSSYPLLYTPAQKFDISIHNRDAVAEYYVQQHCDKSIRSMTMPMAIVGDGNCLYNTFVKLGGAGTTTEASTVTPVELRARNVMELVLHREDYENRYADLNSILDTFEKYVLEEMVHDTNYASVWDLLSIPTVLNVTVMSVYPRVNGDDDLYYKQLNGKTFKPLKSETTTTVRDVKILFSHCNKPVQLGMKKGDWTPNHFLPLLNLR